MRFDASAGVLSGNGQQLAFVSASRSTRDFNSLTPGRFLDVFVRDLMMGTITLVSINSDGTAGGKGYSNYPAISHDGRYIAFESDASDLAANDGNGKTDVFVRDIVARKTTLVSVNFTGSAAGNGDSKNPVLTPDGRYIAFESAASDLVAGDVNDIRDIFVRDVQSGVTRSVTTRSRRLNTGFSEAPAISAEGRFVAFISQSTGLVPGDVGNQRELYLADLRDGSVQKISPPPVNGRPAANCVMSTNGQFLAFTVGNLPQASLYWRDLFSAANELVSTNVMSPPSVSGNGQLICYAAQERSAGPNVYVWNAPTKQPKVVSVRSGSDQPSAGMSESPVISDDGSTVAFLSRAADLTPEGGNTAYQLYIRDLSKQATDLVSLDQTGIAPSRNDVSFPVLSADGTVIAFQSFDNNLLWTDHNGRIDVFYAAKGELLRVSVDLSPLDGKLRIRWRVFPNRRYRVQMKTDLGAASWVDAAELPRINNGIATWVDGRFSADELRFFRVVAF